MLVHLLAVGAVGVDLWSPPDLPRFEFQEVAGVEVPPEPDAVERPSTSNTPATKQPPTPPTASSPPTPPAAPEPDRPEGTALTASLAADLPVDDGSRSPAEPAPAPRNVEPTESPDEAAPDGGPDGAAEGDGGPPAMPALALPEGAAEGDMGPLMAGEARVALLVRTDLLSSAAEAHSLRRTMRMVPGFREYFGQSGLDPLTDFRWMTLRTPDPTRVDLSTVTASLAVDLVRARAMVDRVPGAEGRVAWSTLPDGGPTLGTLTAPPDAGPADPRADVAWAIMDPGDLLLAGPRAWVSHTAAQPAEEAVASAQEGLAEVRLGDSTPALVIAADELRRLVVVPDRSLPVPDTLVMAATFDDESFIVAHLHFSRPAAAERFVSEVQRSLVSWESHPIARLLDLPDLWRHLQIQRRGARVVAAARLGRSEVRRVLALTRWFLAASEEGARTPAPAVDGRGSRP